MSLLTHTFPFVPARPFQFWRSVHKNPKHGFILGSGDSTAWDKRLMISVGEPDHLIQDQEGLAEISNEIKKTESDFDIPRYVGFFGFELGKFFDEGIGRLSDKPNPLKTPALSLGDYKDVLMIDVEKRTTVLYSHRDQSESSLKEFEKLVGKIKLAFVSKNHAQRNPRKAQYKSSGSSKKIKKLFGYPNLNEFSKKVESAKESIRKGDIYQANLSFRLSAKIQIDPIDFYQVLCEKNPSPFSCLLKVGKDWIVSCSPELLLKVEGGRLLTRPIAGTRPRGSTVKKDRLRKGQLLLSPKERAEHIMLVDLERNDLGRVSKPGSVEVSARYEVERYSHVMHIVSEVQGKLHEGANAMDALKAVFPGGTITGCPKIKSIEVLSDLEGVARGPFYGSAGYFSWNGNANFNILIRTALLKPNQIHIQAGAGIVADSQPKREYQEVLAKAQALLETAVEVCE